MALVLLEFEDLNAQVDEDGDVMIISKSTGTVYGILYENEVTTLYEEVKEMKKNGG